MNKFEAEASNLFFLIPENINLISKKYFLSFLQLIELVVGFQKKLDANL